MDTIACNHTMEKEEEVINDQRLEDSMPAGCASYLLSQAKPNECIHKIIYNHNTSGFISH